VPADSGARAAVQLPRSITRSALPAGSAYRDGSPYVLGPLAGGSSVPLSDDPPWFDTSRAYTRADLYDSYRAAADEFIMREEMQRERDEAERRRRAEYRHRRHIWSDYYRRGYDSYGYRPWACRSWHDPRC
jgi:hypothetical protein